MNFMYYISGIMSYNTMIFLGEKMINNDEQQSVVVVNYDIDKVFNAINNSINTISGFKIKNSNHITHTFSISTGVSWTSWGEIMNISLIDLGENKTKIIVSSVSKVNSLFGANSKNAII